MRHRRRFALLGDPGDVREVPIASDAAKKAACEYLRRVAEYTRKGLPVSRRLSTEQQVVAITVACTIRVFNALCLQRFRQTCDQRYLILLSDSTTGEMVALKYSDLAPAELVGSCTKEKAQWLRNVLGANLSSHASESTWNVPLAHMFEHQGKTIKLAMAAFDLEKLQIIRVYGTARLVWSAADVSPDKRLVCKIMHELRKAGMQTRYDLTKCWILWKLMVWLAPALKDGQCRACGCESNLRSCTACRVVRYCSPECQARDWQVHKRECKDDAVFWQTCRTMEIDHRVKQIAPEEFDIIFGMVGINPSLGVPGVPGVPQRPDESNDNKDENEAMPALG